MTTATATYQLHIPAPPERVWAALREPEQVAQWFGWDYPGLAEEIQTIFVHGADGVGLTWTLHLGLHDVRLTAEGEGTRLAVFHAPNPPADQAALAEMLPEIDEGWIGFFEQLRFWLGEGPQGLRHAPHLSGLISDGDARPVWAKLGLAAAPAPGEAFRFTLPWGEEVSGEGFFHSPLQLGLKLPAWGPGLLLFAHAPTQPPMLPHEDASVTFLTYGQGPEAAEALLAPWSAWWAQHHEG